MASYTVVERSGCRIVFGALPVQSLLALSDGLSPDAVMDAHVARLLGATFAIGNVAALEALANDPDVLREARARAEPHIQGLSVNAADWFVQGERGASSDAMFHVFTGRCEASSAHPSDPADLRRCRLLLEQVPEFGPRLPEMRHLSPCWARLCDNWDSLCAVMDEEESAWRAGLRSAPSTYRAMKELGL
jgi:hypothetical protein